MKAESTSVDSTIMLNPPLRLDKSYSHKSTFATLAFRRRTLTVTFNGPSIGEREATILAHEINEAVECVGSQIRSFVIDLRNVQMMSSIGLGMCIDARNRCAQLGATAYAIGLSSQLWDLFKLMKVHRLYKMIQDESDLDRALAA